MMFEIKDGLMVEINEFNKTASIAQSPKATGDIFIPNFFEKENIKYKIISIRDYAFEKCNIDSLTFPEDSEIETFGVRCFSTANIKKLQIPAKVKTIDGCFIRIKDLQEIDFSSNNQHLLFHNNQYLLGKSDDTTNNFDILHFAMFNVEAATIPPQIKVIKEYSFYFHKKLNSIQFSPNSELRIIENNAFSYTKITDLLFPASLEEIKEQSFENASNLKTVKFMPNSNLKKMMQAFSNSKIASISLPASVEYIDDECFSFTPNLCEIEVSEENKFFKSINGDYVEMESVKNSGVFDTILIARRNIESVTIPAHIKVISSNAFQRCKKLKKIVFEPNSSLELIKNYVFCSFACEELVLPPSLKEVGSNSFSGNSKLKSIEFLSKSIILKDGCLNSCAVLSIIFQNADQITFQNKAMNGIPDNAKILVRKNAQLSGEGLEDCRSKTCTIEEEEERLRKEEEERKQKEEEEKLRKEEEERLRKEEEERLRKEEEERLRKEVEERLRKEEEERLRKEENNERIQKEDNERLRMEEEERKQKEEDERKQKEDNERLQTREVKILPKEEPKKVENPIETKKPTFICAACKKQIDTDRYVYYSGRPYHFECVKCSKCNKTFSTGETTSDYRCISPGVFLCERHYNEQAAPNAPKQKFMKEYNQKRKENLFEEVFNKSLLNDEDTSSYPEDEVLVTQEMVDHKIEKNQYEGIIPTIALHVDKPPQEIDCDKLPEVLGDNVAILDVEKKVKKKESKVDNDALINIPEEEEISTIITIALLSCIDLEHEEIKKEHKTYVENLKVKLNSSIGDRAIIGNLDEEPVVDIPDVDKVNKALNKPSINQFQSTVALKDKDVKEIRKKIFEKIKKEKGKENWKYVFSHADLYKELETQVRKDIKENPYEMIIVGQTLITSKFLENEYKLIKSKLKDNAFECFLYHGSKLVNHPKIAHDHFLNPAQDKEVKTRDSGYYGIGIYATDNIFYASMYANGYNVLEINGITYVISCRSIYNKNEVLVLKDLSKQGKKFDEKTAKNYGINRAFVGSENNYKPIDEKDKDQNKIWANEFVFAIKDQFIPFCTFTVMRKDHYILWMDENLDNNENSKYMKELSKNMEVNIYGVKSVDEALKIIKTKKYAAIKLITSAGGDKKTGKVLIEEARKIIHSNFVSLVFTSNVNHMEWVSQMENVILTTNQEEFKEFAKINMNVVNILDFVNKIRKPYEKQTGYQFKINEEELLHFPNCDDDSYYRIYNYRNPMKGLLSKILFSKFFIIFTLILFIILYIKI
ncbi:hypothetical protein M9Y10_015960 [Tritrichomonas musculus]|uniref:LIM zinc-binding domain-containing protein n=1 Tax=Tritrichomonas musculus TaxID=1915356 RepID=A0ABR2I7W4_9EUKA